MKSRCKICRQPATRKRGLASLCDAIECEAELGKPAPVKRKAPKKRAGHDKSMLDACRGQQCYLQVPSVCCGNNETVVPCHANWPEFGKAMGLKAKDEFTVPGCFTCHAWLDQGFASREEKREVWINAYERWKVDRNK